MKTCTKCFLEKEDDGFYFLKDSRGGRLSAYCKPCTCVIRKEFRNKYPELLRKRKKEYYEKNKEEIKIRDAGRYKRYAGKYKEKARIYWIKTKYGINQEQFNAMRASQGNKCAICETDFVTNGMKTNFGIDHCHRTGKARALLCKNCNTGLGMAKDSVDTLSKMILYLKKHE